MIHSKSNNMEVEIRAVLNENQSNKLLEKIKSGKAEYIGEEKLIDLYYCKKEVKDFSETEMNDVGTFSLRLRQKEKNNIKKIDMNIKVITTYGDHNAWEEYETEVSSLEECNTIIQTLGYKPFLKIEKVRKSYYLENLDMTVNLESIKDFGIAVEIEIITSKDKAEDAKETIKDYLFTIGINSEQVVPKSITNIIMKEKSQFDGSISL